jgi:hypothetical protein
MRYLLACLFLFVVFTSFSQGIKGTVTDENNEPLAFTTIFVREINDGTTSNAEGIFKMDLAPGTYTLSFQYMGYTTLTRQVEIGEEYVEVAIRLSPQVILLQDVKITAGKEDPAYTIMRKAIAKAKYHTQFLDKYTAEVYIKGTGQLIDAPFFMRKTLKDEGVTLEQVFVTESISEIEFIRPNTYSEKVISIRTSGEGMKDGSPNGYINGSFYNPELANSVSPLSPKAFSYYRFEYDGTFDDRGFEVSKIKVIPRSRGDNVFTGYINIIEDLWSIHSLELDVSKLGIDFHIRQIYAPIKESVWLPVTHNYGIHGKVLGFEFEGNYLASVSKYDVTLNPDLVMEFTVIDEKVAEEQAEVLEEMGLSESMKEVQAQLQDGKEVTRKQLRKVLKEYEKSELQEMEEPEVISNFSFKVDTLAYKHDSVYWAKIRPVPLSVDEVEGYKKTDSLSQVQKMREEGDTLKSKYHKGFKLKDLVLGNSYPMGKGRFQIDMIYPNYNTVDGFNLRYRMAYTRNFKNNNKTWLRIRPYIRYGFSREAWNGKLETEFGFGPRTKRGDLKLTAGRYIEQFNEEEPIHEMLNTFFSLVTGDNYMKIYEKDFVDLEFRKRSDKISFTANAEFMRRRFLENTTDYSFGETKDLTTNAPENEILADTRFEEHEALILSGSLQYRPWLKYRIYNGTKRAITGSSPTLKLKYRRGLVDTDFNHIEGGFRHSFKIGIQGFADVAMNAGFFPGSSSPEYLMDFKHFPGNLTPFITSDPVESFRLLPYYQYSVNSEYFTGYFQYQFRKFLLTRIPLVRIAGVREGFFANYLYNEVSDHYTELGYGINYIFKVIRIEAITSFQNGKYQDFGVRIGIATNLDQIF